MGLLPFHHHFDPYQKQLLMWCDSVDIIRPEPPCRIFEHPQTGSPENLIANERLSAVRMLQLADYHSVDSSFLSVPQFSAGHSLNLSADSNNSLMPSADADHSLKPYMQSPKNHNVIMLQQKPNKIMCHIEQTT